MTSGQPNDENTVQIYTCKYCDYSIEKSRFGLYTSIKTDGTKMTTGLTIDSVQWITENIHLPFKAGEFDGNVSVGGSAVVDGKL